MQERILALQKQLQYQPGRAANPVFIVLPTRFFGKGVRGIRFKRKVRGGSKAALRNFIIAIVLIMIAFVIVINFLVFKSSLTSSDTIKTGNLLITLSMTRDTFAIGEPIHFQLVVKNTSRKPVTLDLVSGQPFDIQVGREMDLLFFRLYRDIWFYSASVPASGEGLRLVLAPGGKRIFSAVWNQHDYRGKPVSPGVYRIRGTLNITGQHYQLQLRGKTSR